MLAISKLTDLLSGKLNDQAAYEYLLEMSKDKPSAIALNELINSVLQVNHSTLSDSIKLFANQTDIIDCCGTGGSGIPHYNTSTSVSFVLAAGGLKVAKFGNRAASGSSGSFDFLEHLGFPIVSSSKNLLEILQRTSLCFLFAPQFYPTLAKLAPIRKSLGKPTLFNLIGPLLNPFYPSFRILGTPTSDAQKAIAEYLLSYKVCKKALIVCADSGLDELNPASGNEILTIDKLSISRSHLSIIFDNKNSKENSVTQLITPQENGRLFIEMVNGSLSPSNYFRTSVTLNAGAGFFVANKSPSIEEGQKLASELLSSGAVLAKFEQCRSIYAKYAR